MTAVAIIPARYASTRLPGKPLSSIVGKPMIQHVVERVEAAGVFDDVIVATDDARIVEAVEAFGGHARMTSADHATGTDRVAEVAESLDADVIVNVQGDEPLIPEDVLRAVVAPFGKDRSVTMTTVATHFRSLDEFLSPNQGKVVIDREGRALFFTRAPIPYDRDAGGKGIPAGAYKTIGIYGFARDFLFRFAKLEPTTLEKTERLEQLRALEHGYAIHVGIAEGDTFGVDTEADLERVRGILSKGGTW